MINKMAKSNSIYILIVAILLIGGGIYLQKNYTLFAIGSQNKIAGLRSTTYGYQQEQSPSWWVGAANFVHSKYPTYDTGFIYGIGGINDVPAGECYLNFPHTGTYSHISFEDTDQNEAYLTAYDNAGYKVFLQVEPGLANVTQLIDLVLTQYSHHSSVIGFGIDTEWLGAPTYSEGRTVTSAELIVWNNRVKSYNPNYKLFLKHWDYSHFPSSYPADVIFIDDSEQLGSFSSMLTEFKDWGTTFSANEVGFQVGYPSDKVWWSKFADPVKTIGTNLSAQIPNMKYYYWVDFSITDVYNGQTPTCNIADTDCNGIISRTELGVFITNWISGTVTRNDLSTAIQMWSST